MIETDFLDGLGCIVVLVVGRMPNMWAAADMKVDHCLNYIVCACYACPYISLGEGIL